MAKFKEPLANSDRNHMHQRFTGAQNVDMDKYILKLCENVPQQLMEKYGFAVSAVPEQIIVGNLLSKKEYPGVLITFINKPNYAQWLIGFNHVGGILDVDAVQYGAVSKNYQRSNASKRGHDFSISGFAKAALNKAMTDKNAVEEEDMYYDALLDVVRNEVQSWVA